MKYNDPWWTCTHSIYLRGNNRLSVLVCVCVWMVPSSYFFNWCPQRSITMLHFDIITWQQQRRTARKWDRVVILDEQVPKKKNSLRAAHNSIPIKMRAAHDTGHKRNNETGALKVGQLKFSSVLPAARCQLSGSFTAKIFRTNNNVLMTASFPDNFNTYG